MNWRDHLQARLLDIRPDSVCALDAAAHQLARDVLRDIPVRAPGNPPGQPCTLALGIDALKGLDAQQAQHLISQARLYTAPRMLIAAPPDCALDETTFRALGFMLSATDTAENVRIYDYDLTTYKTVPDWLNARFWANPERWEP
ncbi:MAG: hypothetical protein HY018_04540 [Hydrogenophilales bacterium]|nr:hypothetical protein [Hydrogenophilales bacterium]